MIKAVFDSSVLVAALLTPKGLARALVDRAKAKEFALCLSPEIITETHKRLVTRKHLRERYGYTDEEVAYFIRGIQNIASLVSELPTVRVVRDPNDDFILATAIKAAADSIIWWHTTKTCSRSALTEISRSLARRHFYKSCGTHDHKFDQARTPKKRS